MAGIAELMVRVSANVKEFEKGMSGMQKNLENVSKQMTNLGKTMTLAVTTPVVAGFTLATKGAAELAGATDKFNVVFRGMEKEMMDWVETYRTEFPLAKREIIAHSAALQDLLVPMGISRKDAAGMTQEWMELAGALSAFNDVPIAEALDAIRSGITGASEPLARFGINAKVSALEQTALKNGLIKTGQEMSEQVRLQALLIQSYDQSSDAVNGLEEQKGSLLWVMQEIQATIKDLGDAFGAILLPYVQKAAEFVRDLLARFQALDESTKKIIIVIAIVAAVIGPLLLAFGVLAGLIANIIVIWPVLMAIVGATGPILIIIGVVWLLIAAGVALYKNWDNVVAFGKKTWESFKDFFVNLWEGIKNAVLDIWNSIVDGIKGFINNIIDGINILINAINKIPGIHIGEVSKFRLSTDQPAIRGFASFATGGIVPGPVGMPQLAVVHGGEEVRTPAQQSQQSSDTFNITLKVDAKDIDSVQKIIRLFEGLQQGARAGLGVA